MPELPEVEVLRRDLEPLVAGRQVERVALSGPRTVRRQPPAEVVARLEGTRLAAIERIGKYLVVSLDDGADALVVHLRMSGQLLLVEPGRPHVPHTHAVMTLSGGAELRFVDPRTFGELFVAPRPVAALAHLGVDPIGPEFTPDRLSALMAGRRGRLKALLLDQRVVAGLGNIYSDEALFGAGLRFDRAAGSLDPGEVSALHHSITTTLRRAIESRGSSLSDGQYVDLFGRPGGYQHHHLVYAREGRPCPRCDAPIRRGREAGRSTFYCDACQAARP